MAQAPEILAQICRTYFTLILTCLILLLIHPESQKYQLILNEIERFQKIVGVFYPEILSLGKWCKEGNPGAIIDYFSFGQVEVATSEGEAHEPAKHVRAAEDQQQRSTMLLDQIWREIYREKAEEVRMGLKSIDILKKGFNDRGFKDAFIGSPYPRALFIPPIANQGGATEKLISLQCGENYELKLSRGIPFVTPLPVHSGDNLIDIRILWAEITQDLFLPVLAISSQAEGERLVKQIEDAIRTRVPTWSMPERGQLYMIQIDWDSTSIFFPTIDIGDQTALSYPIDKALIKWVEFTNPYRVHAERELGIIIKPQQFSEVFPNWYQFWMTNPMLNLWGCRAVVDNLIEKELKEVKLLYIEVPKKIAVLVGPLVIIVLLLTLSLHLHKACSMLIDGSVSSKAVALFPSILFYRELSARWIVVLSVFFLPLTTIGYVAVLALYGYMPTPSIVYRMVSYMMPIFFAVGAVICIDLLKVLRKIRKMLVTA